MKPIAAWIAGPALLALVAAIPAAAEEKPAAEKPAAAKPAAKHKASKGDATKGKAVYDMYCWTCHGHEGKGDGPSAAGLPVKPRDHTDDSKMSKLSDDQIFKTVKEGGKSVGKSEQMPAWGGALKDDQIRDVVAFVRSLHRKKST